MKNRLIYRLTIALITISCIATSCKSDEKPQDKTQQSAEQKPVKKKPKIQPAARTEKAKPAPKAKALSNTIKLGNIDYNLISARLLQKVNQERKRLSLPVFKNNNDLTKAAKTHNDYMVRADVLDHNENGTSTPTMRDRVTQTGGKFRTAGENIQYEGFIIRTTNGVESIIAPTYEALAEQLWQNWKTSPTHYKNIINPEFKYLGTALKWSDKKTAIFATQVYGG